MAKGGRFRNIYSPYNEPKNRQAAIDNDRDRGAIKTNPSVKIVVPKPERPNPAYWCGGMQREVNMDWCEDHCLKYYGCSVVAEENDKIVDEELAKQRDCSGSVSGFVGDGTKVNARQLLITMGILGSMASEAGFVFGGLGDRFNDRKED